MSHSRELEYFNRMTAYLQQNTGNNHRIKVSDLCRTLGISNNYLITICKNVGGTLPHIIINKYCVEKATEYYHKNLLPEKLIAEKLGFSEASAFCHFFKEFTGKNLKSHEID